MSTEFQLENLEGIDHFGSLRRRSQDDVSRRLWTGLG
jgi:hypothetical protein